MVKYKLAATFLWLVTGFLVPVYAQQSSESLNDLWRNVAEDYSGIKAKQTAADAAAFNERALKSNRLPQIKVQAQSSYGTYDGIGGAFFPQAGFFNVSGDASLYGANLSSNSFGIKTKSCGEILKSRYLCFQIIPNAR
ncbi:TolC family protein, partial [Flavobacterium frigidarium]